VRGPRAFISVGRQSRVPRPATKLLTASVIRGSVLCVERGVYPACLRSRRPPGCSSAYSPAPCTSRRIFDVRTSTT